MTTQEQPQRLNVTVELTAELAPGALVMIRRALKDTASLGATAQRVTLRVELAVDTNRVDIAAVRKALQNLKTPQSEATTNPAILQLSKKWEVIARAILRMHEQGKAFRHADIAANITQHGDTASSPTISRAVEGFMAAGFIVDPRELGKPARTPLTLTPGAEEKLRALLAK